MGGQNSGRTREDNIWKCKVTVHSSFREDTNAVLLRMAKTKRLKKSEILQHIIETHPEFQQVEQQMEEEGFFI